ncbi:hypothetical protein A7A08_01677 [Methyloligella halotolerans]|uniref:Uncharacterized protein n=1 Tax=Methyloligella halotolerans TaxID=1177755 RepID=A0A1E2RZR3_9HYPH|nr:hypothetical protein [Methyloligella halotolerans]ODA67642.1 hypothetical protein A7A08_01677 [Methyloligella halotolerans]
MSAPFSQHGAALTVLDFAPVTRADALTDAAAAFISVGMAVLVCGLLFAVITYFTGGRG